MLFITKIPIRVDDLTHLMTSDIYENWCTYNIDTIISKNVFLSPWKRHFFWGTKSSTLRRIWFFIFNNLKCIFLNASTCTSRRETDRRGRRTCSIPRSYHSNRVPCRTGSSPPRGYTGSVAIQTHHWPWVALVLVCALVFWTTATCWLSLLLWFRS